MQIDTFYIVDFDRCLGDVDGLFELLKNVTNDLYGIKSDELQYARDIAESAGSSFNALGHITQVVDGLDIDVFKKVYIEKAKGVSDAILEHGATEFIKYLESNNKSFCIISYGDNDWQKLKIDACGLGYIKSFIVSSPNKSQYIRPWYDSKKDGFQIPSSLFNDNISRFTDDVVLIDDKMEAFNDLPDKVRGYYIDINYSNMSNNIAVHPRVKTVKRIDEIISLELGK